MISAAATKQRSKTMSPMIETTAVGWLTLPPLAGADRVDDDRADRAEDHSEDDRRRRRPPAPGRDVDAVVWPGWRTYRRVRLRPLSCRPGPAATPARPGPGSCARRPRVRRRPTRSISTGSIPAARAPATSSDGESPTWMASAARAPASDNACSNTAGDGLATPIAAELTAPSSSGASPVMLEHLQHRHIPVGDRDDPDPAGAGGEQRVAGIVERDEPQRGQQRAQQLIEVEIEVARARRPATRHAAPRRSAAAAHAASGRHARRPCARGRTPISARNAVAASASETTTPNRVRSSERSRGAGRL